MICFILLTNLMQFKEEEDRKDPFSYTKVEFHQDVKPQWSLKGEPGDHKDGIKVHTSLSHCLMVSRIDKLM